MMGEHEHDGMEGVVSVKLDRTTAAGCGGGGVVGARQSPAPLPASIRLPPSRRGSRCHYDESDEDNDDSDSDEGLTMARRKKKPVVAAATATVAGTGSTAASTGKDGQAAQTHPVERLVGMARRRDTNASVGSTETAKKVFAADSE
jgi:[calcium/calmodulin-dependent protein kinase] kinase